MFREEFKIRERDHGPRRFVIEWFHFHHGMWKWRSVAEVWREDDALAIYNLLQSSGCRSRP